MALLRPLVVDLLHSVVKSGPVVEEMVQNSTGELTVI